MGEHANLEKREVRRQSIAERRRLSCEQIAAASRAICDRVVRLNLFQRAQHLVAYASAPDEVDTGPIVRAGLDAAKTVFFPRLRGAVIDFLAQDPSALRPGSYGLLEPVRGTPLIDADGVLFLVPGMAFAPCGARLGRGGGHYDRALTNHPLGFRLGLAAEVQVRTGIPQEPWDQPMDAVVTERRLLWTAARSSNVTRSRLEETRR